MLYTINYLTLNNTDLIIPHTVINTMVLGKQTIDISY